MTGAACALLPPGVDGGSGGEDMRKPFDVVVMFLALWLLSTKIIDVATPKELNVWLIGSAIAPATLLTALFYYRRVPLLDFATAFSALWLATTIGLSIITPKPLSDLATWIGLALPMMTGVAIRFATWDAARKMMSRYLFRS
jgi:hypothetical protein